MSGRDSVLVHKNKIVFILLVCILASVSVAASSLFKKEGSGTGREQAGAAGKQQPEKFENPTENVPVKVVGTLNGGSAESSQAQGPASEKGGERKQAIPETGGDTVSGAAKNDRIVDMPETADVLVSDETTYVVRKRETLKQVSAKTGVSPQVIAMDNGLDPKKSLQRGTVLCIKSRRIVPKPLPEGIVINIPERNLYLFKEGRLLFTYPVGLGKITKSRLFAWHTPTGKFTVTSKAVNPSWHIPPSIQQERNPRRKVVPVIVPPGPRNPLGKYALRTTFDGILIHGTRSPSSIRKFSSHGCVRMLPRDIETLFKNIKVNMDGEILYQPVKVAVSDEGRVFMEVHADAYGRIRDLELEARRLLEERDALDRVDWNRVKALLKSGNGRVEDISI